MKVLISHSYFLRLDPKEADNSKPYPPLAPITLAGWIRQELGQEAEFYDVMFDDDASGLAGAIRRQRPDVFILYDDDFNFLTKMCLLNMREALFTALQQAPKTGLFIAHGSDASDQAEQYLRAGFDFVVHRNAELTILKMLGAYIAKPDAAPLRGFNGISYLDAGVAVHKPQIKNNVDPAAAPPPAWDKVDLTPYRRRWVSRHGYFSLNISTAHGCPYRCNWCAKPLYGRTYKAIPAARAAEEFDRLHRQLRADHIWVTDDLFALKPGWITEFADALQARNISVPFKCQNRADQISEEFAAELARAGCQEVWLGVESGSQKILNAMDKDESIETIRIANRRLKAQGIRVGFFLQYGYPGEDYQDILLTLRLIKECRPDHVGVSVSYPLKGTTFYERVMPQLGEKQNWHDSADLDLMFQGTYGPEFYRALHRYTHHYFGFISLFKPQPLWKRMRRLAAQSRHIPGMIKYRRIMQAYR